MALVTGPLFSVDASGKLADSLVYAKWKGRNYVREYVIPSNPRSLGQRVGRAMLAFLSQEWSSLSTADKNSWASLGAASSYSPFNAYIRNGLDRLRDAFGPTQAYPALDTAPASGLNSLTATGASGKITGAAELNLAQTNEWGIGVTILEGAVSSDAMAQTAVIIRDPSQDSRAYEINNLEPGTYSIGAFVISEDGGYAADVLEVLSVVVT